MSEHLRLRVFAGPNGSGKTTIINSIRSLNVNGRPIDFGIYINADDIANELRLSQFSFSSFGVNSVTTDEIIESAVESGLLSEDTERNGLISSIEIIGNQIVCSQIDQIEPLAQLLADFLRKKLLEERGKFSFETVFSHHGKVDLMCQSSNLGYKVYLYFVGTESPEINKYRVRSRVAKGGHDVPEDKVVSRYYRSMNLLKDAAQCCHQAFFFDNSNDGEKFTLFAHFKVIDGKKVWDPIDSYKVPQWFQRYYANKV
jgi:predicted ABC-type ATPase